MNVKSNTDEGLITKKTASSDHVATKRQNFLFVGKMVSFTASFWVDDFRFHEMDKLRNSLVCFRTKLCTYITTQFHMLLDGKINKISA